MVNIFLSSHGHLASGFKSSIEILLGTQDKLTVFDAYVTPESVEDKLEAFYSTVKEGEQVLLLADIVGGSVANSMAPFSVRENTFLIAGVNLATLLELCLLEKIDIDTLNIIIEQGKGALKLLAFDENECHINNDDFF